MIQYNIITYIFIVKGKNNKKTKQLFLCCQKLPTLLLLFAISFSPIFSLHCSPLCSCKGCANRKDDEERKGSEEVDDNDDNEEEDSDGSEEEDSDGSEEEDSDGSEEEDEERDQEEETRNAFDLFDEEEEENDNNIFELLAAMDNDDDDYEQ